MQERICPFGPLLVAHRKNAGLSQWQFAVRTGVNVTNLRKIEKGKTQPGVITALYIVEALNIGTGNFFSELAQQQNLISDKINVTPSKQSILSKFDKLILKIQDNNQNFCLFGIFFKLIRLELNISQKYAVNYAQYQLRNILDVESGKQEPGVMTALALVCATGCDVAWFFNLLAEHSLKIYENKISGI